MYECVCPCMSEAGSKQHFGVSTLFSFQCPALGKVTRIIPLLLCSLAHFCLFGYVVCSYCTDRCSLSLLCLVCSWFYCWFAGCSTMMFCMNLQSKITLLVAFVLFCILRVLKLNLWSSCSSACFQSFFFPSVSPAFIYLNLLAVSTSVSEGKLQQEKENSHTTTGSHYRRSESHTQLHTDLLNTTNSKHNEMI